MHYSCRVNRPSVPTRKDSLTSNNVPESLMESLVGRAKYEGPVCAKVKNDVLPNTVLPEGYCDKLFQQEDDSYSMQSYAASIGPSITQLECDIPSAIITTTDGVHHNLSQESNNSVLSSTSSESSKDQHSTGDVMHRTTSSFQRKRNLKGKYRPKPSPIMDNHTNGIRRSISPRDVIKEDEVLDLSQENDIMALEMPRVSSPVAVS